MFFLIGRRYPWVSLIGGAAVLTIGIVTGYIGSMVLGSLALAVGGYRVFAALRRRGHRPGPALPGGGLVR